MQGMDLKQSPMRRMYTGSLCVDTFGRRGWSYVDVKLFLIEPENGSYTLLNVENGITRGGPRA